MNPHKFWFWWSMLVVAMLVGIWLNPGYLYRIDWFFILMLGVLMLWTMTGYFWAELHRGGYPIVSFKGHSATFNGSPSFYIPALKEYPEMAAIPKGGGNYMGFPSKGGRKEGWLIVPREQLHEMNRALWANTVTSEVEPAQLPSHIRRALEDHELYHPAGMVEFGVWPHTRDLKEIMLKQKGFDYDNALARSNEQVKLLEDENKAMRNNLAALSEVLASVGVSISRVPTKESINEKVSSMVSGDEHGGA